jgi:hypothetical protein
MTHINDQICEKKGSQSILGVQTQQLLALAEMQHWSMQVLGKAPMLKQPMRIQDWLLVPSTMDSTPLPDHAFRRIKTLYEAGIRPQGFVMVHEAPLQLKAPIVQEKPKTDKHQWAKIGGAALGLGAITGSLVVAVGIAIIGSLLILPLGLFAAIVLVDPILVAVMPDDTWIEIDRWDIQ